MSWFPSAWSPTSLAGLETCPRRWALRRAGHRPKSSPLAIPSPHADFGRIWHAAAETHDRARFAGLSSEAATEAAIEFVLEATWRDGAPWGGAVVEMWTCRDGVERAASGRRKFLCDAARDWWLGAPDRCSKCGGAVKINTRYVPAHPSKNRVGLLRAVEAYCASVDQFGIDGDAAGPMLEREFEFEWAPGVPGHFIADRLSRLDGVRDRRMGHERKTTGRNPSRGSWDALRRSYQAASYYLGAGVRDIVYEIVTISARGAEVMRQILSPDRTVVEETSISARVLADIAGMARDRCGDDPLAWPGRFAACATAAGGQPCEFLALCNAARDARPYRLVSDFVREERSNA